MFNKYTKYICLPTYIQMLKSSYFFSLFKIFSYSSTETLTNVKSAPNRHRNNITQTMTNHNKADVHANPNVM